MEDGPSSEDARRIHCLHGRSFRCRRGNAATVNYASPTATACANARLCPPADQFAGDNWYDYPKALTGSPKNLRGIDRGESSSLLYAFNVLIGHHGLFSLTPLWLLSVAGCCDLAGERRRTSR